MSINTHYIFLLLFFITSTFDTYAAQKSYTIMLDPAGDARHTGRIIGTSFERTLTFQIAQALQQALQATCPCSVIITRSSGETVYPLQSANFANRLPIDLYISLHCYYAPREKHTIALYLLAYSSMSPSSPQLAMVPFTNAHWQSCTTTQKYASHMHTMLESIYAHQFHIPPVVALPFVPLTGIIAPAIGIEINCISSDDIPLYVEPLAKTIVSTLTL